MHPLPVSSSSQLRAAASIRTWKPTLQLQLHDQQPTFGSSLFPGIPALFINGGGQAGVLATIHRLPLLQVRSTGPVNPVTRQPIKGRKFGGGIRFGEMERDALLAHGAAYLLHDRLHTCSDYTVMEVCSACGSLLSPNQFIPTATAADMPRAAGGKPLQICCFLR